MPREEREEASRPSTAAAQRVTVRLGGVGGSVRRGAVLHLRAVGGGRRLAARRRWLPRRLALRARLRQKVVAVGRRAAVGEERAHGGGAAAAVAVVGEVVDSEAAVGAVEAARAEDRLVLGVA
eukprot:scaffold34592_cov63-Phaeocystis_antarctica.AAC.7